jgi:hypothetical protein
MCLSFSACEDKEEPFDPPVEVVVFDFTDNSSSWQGGFADLPVDNEQTPRSSFELEATYSDAPIGDSKTFKLSGKNLSADLFMFLYRKMDQLEPNQTYFAQIDVDLFSAAGLVGIGGPPGESVLLKAGVLEFKPSVYAEAGYEYLNVDKGSPSEEGREMVNLGNIAHDGPADTYQLIKRSHSKIIQFKSNADGEAWLIIGSDSGFEGQTTLYYDQVTITFGTSEF